MLIIIDTEKQSLETIRKIYDAVKSIEHPETNQAKLNEETNPNGQQKNKPKKPPVAICSDCGCDITSQNVVDYCREHSDKFDKKVLCFECQQEY